MNRNVPYFRYAMAYQPADGVVDDTNMEDVEDEGEW